MSEPFTDAVFSRYRSGLNVDGPLDLVVVPRDGWESSVGTWQGPAPLDFPSQPDESTAIFGFVASGRSQVAAAGAEYRLLAGQYFCLAPPFRIQGGKGFIVRHRGFSPIPLVGGPIEPTGRLRYVSGCTDTLLIGPPRFGDPCLNALYFPPHTDQVPHTHPSVRIGMIVAGRGEAVLQQGTVSLETGDVFAIQPEGRHSFRTLNASMTVIAYHPDSDFGPRDEDHPMINRTIVDGQSAAGTRHATGDSVTP